MDLLKLRCFYSNIEISVSSSQGRAQEIQKLGVVVSLGTGETLCINMQDFIFLVTFTQIQKVELHFELPCAERCCMNNFLSVGLQVNPPRWS